MQQIKNQIKSQRHDVEKTQNTHVYLWNKRLNQPITNKQTKQLMFHIHTTNNKQSLIFPYYQHTLKQQTIIN